MNGCCFKNLQNPKRLGRACYVCPTCNTNVTLALVFINDAERHYNKPDKKEGLDGDCDNKNEEWPSGGYGNSA